jgi:hypothetical protein
MIIHHFPATNAVDCEVLHMPEADETMDLAAGYYVVTERTGPLVMLARCGEDEDGWLVAEGEGEPVPAGLLSRMAGTGLAGSSSDAPRRDNYEL